MNTQHHKEKASDYVFILCLLLWGQDRQLWGLVGAHSVAVKNVINFSYPSYFKFIYVEYLSLWMLFHTPVTFFLLEMQLLSNWHLGSIEVGLKLDGVSHCGHD
jgi:hypothetical protein